MKQTCVHTTLCQLSMSTHDAAVVTYGSLTLQLPRSVHIGLRSAVLLVPGHFANLPLVLNTYMAKYTLS